MTSQEKKFFDTVLGTISEEINNPSTNFTQKKVFLNSYIKSSKGTLEGNMHFKRKLACDIVELFEELLQSKEIEVPCVDPDEEKIRHDGENDAKLYGLEYWTLVDRIEDMI